MRVVLVLFLSGVAVLTARPQDAPTPPTTPEDVSTTTPTTTPQDVSTTTPTTTPQDVSTTTPTTPPQDAKISQRIMGGSASTVGEYPFIANMQYGWWGIIFYQYCGGILITRNSVLSAAQCYRNSDYTEWRARLGSSFTSYGGEMHYASQLITNARYNPATRDSDVAIVRLAKAAALGNGIEVATLAGPGYNLQDGADVTAVGWGAQTASGSYPDQVRHVEIQILNQEICASQYASIKGYKVTDNMLCAGSWLGGKDSCAYDEGGPLVHQNVVAGIVSWGNGCGKPGYPGVYVKVNKFTDWVLANTNYEAITTN